MPETSPIRAKTRRVKDHLLTRYLKMVDKVEMEGGVDNLSVTEKAEYEKRSDTFANNILPRTQELGGDPENNTPIPIYGGISKHNGDQKDIQPTEENTSS